MANCYRATINVDYTTPRPNNYQRMQAALIQAGWLHVETSAYIIEDCDLAKIWRGIEIVAKYSSKAGDLSALTFHIQGSDDFAGKMPPSLKNHPDALRDVLSEPFPSP